MIVSVVKILFFTKKQKINVFCVQKGFVISYIVTNYASLALLIYGNATLGAIVSCAVTPCTEKKKKNENYFNHNENRFFSVSFIVFSIKALNPNAAAPTIWDGLSLVGNKIEFFLKKNTINPFHRVKNSYLVGCSFVSFC